MIDAIRSGRPFRRLVWEDELGWLVVRENKDGIKAVEFERGLRPEFQAHVEDLLADDYELGPEPTVTVTATAFNEAIKTAQYETAMLLGQKDRALLDAIARALGLAP